ncbi:MAG: MBL fold metallo-hydrolase [Bacteroidota bacterium]
MAIKIAVIYDNNLVDERLQKDWGFSALIECGDKKILFDTGEDGRILLNNMEILGILPQIIGIVFISHADHDHVNGLHLYHRYVR